MTTTQQAEKVDVLVVGAGFSGLGTVIKLKQAGFRDLVVIERGEDVGGTWRDNTYPGAACDVPSHLYSYSFAPNRDWSRSFSGQAEIYEYIRRVAREYGAYDYMRFGEEVTSAKYDESRGRWTVETSKGTYDARVVVLGVGALCEPRLPDIAGIEDFAGEIFHSARWNHDVSLAGKRVAVIGTGASAIQIVPSIADEVAHLDVYQRTAPWIIPRADREYTSVERALSRNVPGYARFMRGAQWLMRESQVPGFVKSRKAAAPVKAAAQALQRLQISDPELREKVAPKYDLGCKRILISNQWYPTLSRDDVELITEPIQEVTPTGIRTADGVEHPVDVLVNATGFHVTDSPTFELIYRDDGVSLGENWRRRGMSAYKGTTVSGFPNLFVMVGPATGLGHSSMIYMIESQLNYLVGALTTMRAGGFDVAEVRDHVHEAYNVDLRRRTSETVWVQGGCSSWYLDAHGNAPAVWPGPTYEFRNLTREFDPIAYHLSKAPGGSTTPDDGGTPAASPATAAGNGSASESDSRVGADA